MLRFTGADVCDAPALSVAIAVSTKLPSGTLLQTSWNGAVKSSPILFCSSKNSTRATLPSESPAAATNVTSTGPPKLVPFVGLVIETLGAKFVTTVILTGADVLAAPIRSVATAVKTYAPSTALVHVATNGGLVIKATRSPFAKNSTERTPPSGSAADTEIEIGALSSAPSTGETIATVGGMLVRIVTITGADVLVSPTLSCATAVNEYTPTSALLQVSE